MLSRGQEQSFAENHNNPVGKSSVIGKPPSVQSESGFVPKASPETRLRPIVPRGATSDTQNNNLGSSVLVPSTSNGAQNVFQPNLPPELGQGKTIPSEQTMRPIIPGRTDLRSIVEEAFPSAAMTSSHAFYDAVGDDDKLENNRKRLWRSLQRFVDMASIEVVPASEYVW